MPLKEIKLAPFVKGLVIPDSNNETPSGSLIEATNVMLTNTGALRQRAGIGAPDSNSPGATSYGFPYQGDKFVQLWEDGQGGVYRQNAERFKYDHYLGSTPLGITSDATMQQDPAHPETSLVYLASPTSELRTFDGLSFTALPSGTSPKCRYLTTGMISERMWAAGFDAGTNYTGGVKVGPSTLAWSDPRSPQSWPAGNFQDFSPGDGKPITGIIQFSGQILVFKEDRFWVVYGVTVGGGATTLNYREVTGAGLIQPGAFVTSDVGVFFRGKDGIYLTDGSPEPRRVSDQIGGLFTGNLPGWCPYPRLLAPPTRSIQTMAVSDRCLYALAGNVSPGGEHYSCILVYNYSLDAWSYFDLGRFKPVSLGTVSWPEMTQPVVCGLAYETATNTYVPFTLHPRLTEDWGVDTIKVQAATNWWEVEPERGYVAMDTASVLRLDAIGLGRTNVGVAKDFEPEPSKWKLLPFRSSPARDVWGDGTGGDVWGVGASDDVWSDSVAYGDDLVRLTPPDRRFVHNPPGRGRFLSLHFHKIDGESYFYLERPRMTVVSR